MKRRLDDLTEADVGSTAIVHLQDCCIPGVKFVARINFVEIAEVDEDGPYVVAVSFDNGVVFDVINGVGWAEIDVEPAVVK